MVGVRIGTSQGILCCVYALCIATGIDGPWALHSVADPVHGSRETRTRAWKPCVIDDRRTPRLRLTIRKTGEYPGDGAGPSRWTIVTVAAIIITGACFRLAHLTSVDPTIPGFGDGTGGLYLAFANEIAGHGYRLPETIPHYTQGGIPFVYPPLAFYLEAVLLHGLGIPEPWVVHALPPLLAILAMPLLYLMTKVLGLPLPARLLALFVFAVMPSALEEPIQPEGLSEATGMLTLIGLGIGLKKIFERPRLGLWHVLTGAALGLCVMASPGSAYGAAVLFLAFAIWRTAARTPVPRRERFMGLLVATGTGLLVSAPYLATATAHHGVGAFWMPFANVHAEEAAYTTQAMGTGGVRESSEESPRAGTESPEVETTPPETSREVEAAPKKTSPRTEAEDPPSDIRATLDAVLLTLRRFSVSGRHTTMFLLDLAFVLGLILLSIRRQWWVAVCFGILFLMPRESNWMVVVPVSLIAGVGLYHALRALFERLSAQGRPSEALGLIGIALIILAGASMATATRTSRKEAQKPRAPEGFVEVLTRGRTTLPADAGVVTMEKEDWSPLLLQRDVLNMPYGAEWQPLEKRSIDAFNAGMEACRDVACVHAQARETFGVDTLYFVTTDERLRDRRIEPGTSAPGGSVEIIESGGGAIIGRFDPMPTINRTPP